MAKTITQLPDATVVNAADELIVQQGGVTKRATRSELMSEAISSAKFIPTGTSATGNGMYLPATNSVAISTDGSERARIDASGNVGIGNTPVANTTSKLFTSGDVTRVGSNGGFLFNAYFDTGWKYAGSGTAIAITENGSGAIVLNSTGSTTGSAGDAATMSERLRIDSSGNVGIGTNAPSASAILDISSTTKGFLPPRMTTAQRDAISTPPAGLVIYNTSTNVLNFYNGSAWGAV